MSGLYTSLDKVETDAQHSFDTGFYDDAFSRLYEKYTNSEILEEHRKIVLKHMFNARNKYILFQHTIVKQGVILSAEQQNVMIDTAIGLAAKEIHDLLNKEN